MKPAQHVAALAASQDAERLRLAAQASGVAIFDWIAPDDLIVWDGAIDILPYCHDHDRLKRGQAFLNWLSADARSAVTAVLESRSPRQSTFELDIEASSAMGSVWLTFVGMRIPDTMGRTERLTGVMGMPINAQGDIEAENLTLACRNAVLNMIEVLQERGFSREQAYIICSVAVDLRVSNVVDVPNYVVSALLPEAIFGSD